MKLNRVISFVMLFVLLAGVLAGCGTSPATPAEPGAQEAVGAPAKSEVAVPAGGTLVIAMSLDDVVTLDPAYAGETINLLIHINTYDTLVDIRLT